MNVPLGWALVILLSGSTFFNEWVAMVNRKSNGDAVAVQFAREFYGWLLRGRGVQSAVTLAKMSLTHTDAELIVVRGNWLIG